MVEDKEEIKASDEVGKQKKSIFKWIVIAGIVIFLGIGGYVGWNVYARVNENAPETRAEQSIAAKETGSVVFPLRSFIVNLKDKSGIGSKYLKVTMEIEVRDEEEKMNVEKNIPQLTDMILLLLSSQSQSEINTLEGKLELKQGVVSRMNQVLGETIIQKVYFTEFVVQ